MTRAPDTSTIEDNPAIREKQWKGTVFSCQFRDLWYKPGSWRGLWNHFKDLCKGLDGHPVTIMFKHTAPGDIGVEIKFADVAAWERPLKDHELRTLDIPAFDPPAYSEDEEAEKSDD